MANRSSSGEVTSRGRTPSAGARVAGFVGSGVTDAEVIVVVML